MLQQITNWSTWATSTWIQTCKAMKVQNGYINYCFSFDASNCSEEDKFMLSQLIFSPGISHISLNRFVFKNNSTLSMFVLAQVRDCINISESIYSQVEVLLSNQDAEAMQDRIIVQDEEDLSSGNDAENRKKAQNELPERVGLVNAIPKVFRLSLFDGASTIEGVDLSGVFKNVAPPCGSKVALFPGLEKQRNILLLRPEYCFFLGGVVSPNSFEKDRLSFLQDKLKSHSRC